MFLIPEEKSRLTKSGRLRETPLGRSLDKLSNLAMEK